jgi:hypothetical protein
VEDHSQFCEFRTLLVGVALAFLTEVLKDAVVFFVQLVQGSVVFAQEGLLVKFLNVQSLEDALSTAEVVV